MMNTPKPSKSHIVPGKGLIVLNPATGRALPAEGEKVVMDKYWRRRLEDGEISVPTEKTDNKKASSK